MHHQIVAITERDRVRSQQRYLSVLARSAYAMIDRADIDLVGRLTLKAQNDRLGRSMACPGRAQRTKELRR